MYFPFRKVQFHQSALMYVAMATMQLFWLYFEKSNPHCFSSISTWPGRNFLWDNLLCFGHHYTLRSLIEANIRIVTVNRFQKIILCAASVTQWLVLSLSERKVMGSNPPMVVHTPCRSPRLAPGYLVDARLIYPYHLPYICTVYPCIYVQFTRVYTYSLPL